MEKYEQEVDLVVVGSGAGALLAAVRAADEGLKTLVIEKSSTPTPMCARTAR